jgi:hypothetical protein
MFPPRLDAGSFLTFRPKIAAVGSSEATIPNVPDELSDLIGLRGLALSEVVYNSNGPRSCAHEVFDHHRLCKAAGRVVAGSTFEALHPGIEFSEVSDSGRIQNNIGQVSFRIPSALYVTKKRSKPRKSDQTRQAPHNFPQSGNSNSLHLWSVSGHAPLIVEYATRPSVARETFSLTRDGATPK